MLRLSVVLLIALTVVFCANDSVCPELCECKSNTYNCSVCLQRYYRIAAKDYSCPCMDGFKEKTPPVEYCCPWNCTSCTDLGCVSCGSTLVSVFTTNLEVNVCMCKPYRFLGSDKGNPTCICNSKLYPTKFYSNPLTNQCYRCPVGCTCN